MFQGSPRLLTVGGIETHYKFIYYYYLFYQKYFYKFC